MTTPTGRQSLEGLRGRLSAEEKQASEERAEAAANYERLQADIHQALERARTEPEYRSRLLGLSAWLHARVRSTGRLPHGRIQVGRVRYKFNATEDVGIVDFDAFFRK